MGLLRAQRQLANDAGIFVQLQNFKVINLVGASSLSTTINCEAFAAANSDTCHYDHSSFIGLAWRPVDEPMSCEVYNTGRAK